MNWLKSIYRVWRRESLLVFTDIGVLLFFVALPLGYPIIYTLIYNPEVVKDISTVVVDNSRTAESRELVRTLDATQGIKIVGYAANMGEAKTAMHEKKCYGVVEIPHDYAKKIGRGEPTVMSFYSDMSLLLRYRQFLFSLTDVRMAETAKITAERLSRGGILTTVVSGLPVNSESFFLGDPTQGFASFVMPGIVVLILQQSLILGVLMLGGASSERRRKNFGVDPLEVSGPMSAAVLGRAMSYFTIYAPLVVYIFHYVPLMFSLPAIGNPLDYLLFIVPMIFASTFLGQMMRPLVVERESSFLVFVFSSVLFLFLSGITWPNSAMSPVWRLVAGLIPASWGVQGFVGINSNNATLADMAQPYLILWAMAIVYFFIAVNVEKMCQRHALRHYQVPSVP